MEVDTSDNKKRLSTRIVRMISCVDPSLAITQILKDTAQASLRWPASIKNFCDTNQLEDHTKEDLNNLAVLQQNWLQHLLLCVMSWMQLVPAILV